MPLSQSSRNTTPNRSRHQVGRGRNRSTDKSVKQAVLEAGQKRRRKATAGEKRVGFRFSYTINFTLVRKRVALGISEACVSSYFLDL